MRALHDPGMDTDEYGDEDLDVFGDSMSREIARASRMEALELVEEAEADAIVAEALKGPASDMLDILEEAYYEAIRLRGTHLHSTKSTEALMPSYKGAVCYDSIYQRYYVLVLQMQNRYISVISDLHRFSENFDEPKLAAASDKIRTSLESALVRTSEMHKKIEQEVKMPQSLLDFQLQSLSLLKKIERERFNMPWRWNHWSNLYENALHYASRDLYGNEGPFGRRPGSDAPLSEEQQRELKAKAHERRRRLDHRRQRMVLEETEQLRAQYGFEYDEEAGKQL